MFSLWPLHHCCSESWRLCSCDLPSFFAPTSMDMHRACHPRLWQSSTSSADFLFFLLLTSFIHSSKGIVSSSLTTYLDVSEANMVSGLRVVFMMFLWNLGGLPRFTIIWKSYSVARLPTWLGALLLFRQQFYAFMLQVDSRITFSTWSCQWWNDLP